MGTFSYTRVCAHRCRKRWRRVCIFNFSYEGLIVRRRAITKGGSKTYEGIISFPLCAVFPPISHRSLTFSRLIARFVKCRYKAILRKKKKKEKKRKEKQLIKNSIIRNARENTTQGITINYFNL